MNYDFDVLVVGGGPAGLQSALMLGRVGRSVLLFDDGRPRNAPAEHMHYFPSRDGIPPLEFTTYMRKDLAHYPSVELRSATVQSIARFEKGFVARSSDGRQVTARKVILALGVRDILPDLKGMKELFGKSVFHCPYCHGYEFKGQAFGIIANGDMAMHFTSIVLGLTRDITLFTQGLAQFTVAQREALARNNVAVCEEMIQGLEYEGTQLRAVQLVSGLTIKRSALLFRPLQEPKSDLADQLGCTKNEMGLYRVDGDGRTSEPSVFMAGDTMELKQSVMSATMSGMLAAVTANHEMSHENLMAEIGH